MIHHWKGIYAQDAEMGIGKSYCHVETSHLLKKTVSIIYTAAVAILEMMTSLTTR